MTNNEALYILRGLKRYYNDERYNGFYAGFDIEDNEAIDKAIKALEQADVLDKIKDEIAEIQIIGYATVDGKLDIASRAVMRIIDKYKRESEDKNENMV